MYAIYEVFDRYPSGRPESKWADYSIRDGKCYEKRLVGTRADREQAEIVVKTMSKADSNYFYCINID